MRIGRIAAGLVCSVGLLLGGPLGAYATAPDHSVGGDVSDFSFSSFEADYHLERDPSGHSRLFTVETFVAEFPDFDQNRGIIRAIPNHYDGVPLNTEVVSIVDEAGSAVPYEAVDIGGFTELALGTDEFVRGSQTYQITYTQQNVVRAFEDTAADEFYWDTNGTGFDQAFGRVTARVHIDAAVAEYLNGNAACYYGAYGETNACAITLPAGATEPGASDAATGASPSPSNVPEPAAAVFEASAGPLQAGENLTVAVGFEPGTFVQVPAVTGPEQSGSIRPPVHVSPPAWLAVVPTTAILIGIAGAIAQIVRRLTWSRDARGRGTIIPEYSVPTGLSLTVAADLVDRTRTALAAQIVSFAVRGNLRILDDPVRGSGADFSLQLINTDNLEDEELKLLKVLFGSTLAPDSMRELDRKYKGLSVKLSAFPAKARKISIARGWRKKAVDRVGPRIIRTQYITLVLSAAGLISYALLTFDPARSWTVAVWTFPMLFLGVLSLAVSIITQTEKTPLTEAGAERRDYLRGMRMYLQLAEKERFRVLQGPSGADRVTVSSSVSVDAPSDEAVDVRDRVQMVKLYEKLLPFAVLWGVEKEWIAELGRYYDQGAPAPDWFVSSHGFDSRVFSNAIAGVAATSQAASRSASSAMSRWSGSSGGSFSGGSGGGGFSGGGGGGGGGGGR